MPVSGPWSKTAEVMDYLVKIKPAQAFPTHDFLNSDVGNASQDHWLQIAAEKEGIQYKRLNNAEQLQI